MLIVDDIEANRDVLSRRLTRDGYRVATASGGLDALTALASTEFDLVLLDLMMPDINGLDVLLRMKADERLRSVPVIMITGLTETASAIRCIEAGAEDYLPKPFNPVLLQARITRASRKSDGATGSASICSAWSTRRRDSSGFCSAFCPSR